MTAINDRVSSRTDAGRLLEVWAQTLREPLTGVAVPDASWLVDLNGGDVDLLQKPPTRQKIRRNYWCGVWPTFVDDTDLKLSSGERAAAVTTAFWIKDAQQTRKDVEAGIEDLMWYLLAAPLSQTTMVWKGTWSGDPAAGSEIVKGGAGFADRRGQIFSVDLDEFFIKDVCVIEVATDVAWIQSIQTC